VLAQPGPQHALLQHRQRHEVGQPEPIRLARDAVQLTLRTLRIARERAPRARHRDAQTQLDSPLRVVVGERGHRLVEP